MAAVSLLLFVSCKNQSRRDGTSGTIGQVKKYWKEQMTEKDILLRSEGMKDTSKPNEIIQGTYIFDDPDGLRELGDKKFYSLDNLDGLYDLTQLQQYCGGIILVFINTTPIASIFFQQGSQVVSDYPAAQAAGDAAGGGSLPPASPDFGTGVPLVLQGFLMADKDFVGFISPYKDFTQLSITFDQMRYSPSDATENNVRVAFWVSNAVVAATDFVQYAEAL